MDEQFSIAAGHRLTAETGADVLRMGGTAVDAVIASAFMAMAAEPVLAGLLGGGFLMVEPVDKPAQLLDFFTQTPRRRTPEADLDFREIQAKFGTVDQTFHIGAGTIATPGVAPGLAEAHARYGRVPMRELVQPAVAALRKGVEITPYQATLGRIVAAILTAGAEIRALFCQDDAPLPAGTHWRNPAMADVLEVFAIEGPRFVTQGEVAGALLELCRGGGHLQGADLCAYRPIWRDPLIWQRGGANIALNPPPALGGAMIALGLALSGHDPAPVALAHAFAATVRVRMETGVDSAPQDGALRLLAPDLLVRYRREIAGRAAAVRGTTHISVIDRAGMGAALTLSNGEGCGLIVPGTGISPNNMLGEADLLPQGWHGWKPDQRLASMMSPMSVRWPDGRLAMLGSGGSNRIRTALAQVLIALIDRGAALEDAIEAPRLHVEGDDPPMLDFEDLMGEGPHMALVNAFAQSRAWPDRSMFFGGVHGAMRTANGDMHSAGDPRREGHAIRQARAGEGSTR